MALSICRADLHIHSCLSPCADWDMTPVNIIHTAKKRNIDMIAICDHNSAENVAAIMRLGKQNGVHVFAGLEICTREEVHMLTLFDTAEQACQMQSKVYEALNGTNDPELFGYQVVANEFDEVEYQCDRLLASATTLRIQEVADYAKGFNGFVIAAHIDRPAFGIINQLGFIAEDMPFDCLEVSFRTKPESMDPFLTGNGKFAFISSSDAHFTHEIGVVTTKFLINEFSVAELRKAVQGKEGRKKV